MEVYALHFAESIMIIKLYNMCKDCAVMQQKEYKNVSRKAPELYVIFMYCVLICTLDLIQSPPSPYQSFRTTCKTLW